MSADIMSPNKIANIEESGYIGGTYPKIEEQHRQGLEDPDLIKKLSGGATSPKGTGGKADLVEMQFDGEEITTNLTTKVSNNLHQFKANNKLGTPP